MKNIANPWTRGVAFGLDFLIGSTILLLLLSLMAKATTISAILDGLLWLMIAGFLLLPLVRVFVNCFLVSSFGGTVGKILTGLVIVNPEGKYVSFWRAFLRNRIGYMVSGMFLWLGFFWIFKDPERRGWHDQIADTYVVQKSKMGVWIGILSLIILGILNIFLIGGIISNVAKNADSQVYAPIGQMMEDWSKSVKDTNTNKVPEEVKTIYFKGTVTDRLRCGVGGECALVVVDEAGKQYTIQYDFSAPASCDVLGQHDKTFAVGEKVEFFAAEVSDTVKNGLNAYLCGSKDYYLRKFGGSALQNVAPVVPIVPPSSIPVPVRTGY